MYGLRKEEVENIIKYNLDKNPDLKYYIDNDYIYELINLLIEGVGVAIEKNNQKIEDDYEMDNMLKGRGVIR